jgi:hypothetical protein
VDVLHRFFPSGLTRTRLETPQLRRLGAEFKALLLIGLLTTVVDVVLLRTWSLVENAAAKSLSSNLDRNEALGPRILAARQAYDFINAKAPANVIIEPDPSRPLDIPLGLYADRQIAVAGQTAYGVSQPEFANRASSIAEIFKADDWTQIDISCKQLSIDLVVVNDLDALWQRLPDLGQGRAPMYRNAYYAVLPCGTYANP